MRIVFHRIASGPSAIRALARMRGTTVGIDYAEAFALVRELER